MGVYARFSHSRGPIRTTGMREPAQHLAPTNAGPAPAVTEARVDHERALDSRRASERRTCPGSKRLHRGLRVRCREKRGQQTRTSFGFHAPPASQPARSRLPGSRPQREAGTGPQELGSRLNRPPAVAVTPPHRSSFSYAGVDESRPQSRQAVEPGPAAGCTCISQPSAPRPPLATHPNVASTGAAVTPLTVAPLVSDSRGHELATVWQGYSVAVSIARRALA